MNKFEQLAKLFEDKETAEKLLAMSGAEAKVFLGKQGLDFSVEELQEFGKAVTDAANTEGELNETDLDMVAGGDKALDKQCRAVGYRVGQALKLVFKIGVLFL